MKLAVLTIAFNEATHISPCVRQFKPFGLHHLVLVSSLPWWGSPREDDGTADIARKCGAEVIVGYWRNEEEQRNWGLARLYDYDAVLIVDADELYTPEDIKTLVDALANPKDELGRPTKLSRTYRASKIITYWKTTDYVFDPGDKNCPVIAVDPKRVAFKELRMVRNLFDNNWLWEDSPEIPVTIHHLSWVRSDKQALTKIESYSHQDKIPPEWYERVWLSWQPGSDMLVRPYGDELSRAVYSPSPLCIKQLVDG